MATTGAKDRIGGGAVDQYWRPSRSRAHLFITLRWIRW